MSSAPCLVLVPPAGAATAAPPLPRPRGPLSAALIGALAGPPRMLEPLDPRRHLDPLTDDDLHLALYCAYELHYRGLAGVDERWEWHPGIQTAIAPLEECFEAAVRADVGPLPTPTAEAMPESLRSALMSDPGRSLSDHMDRRGTTTELREFAVHRSAYQLKEADPHTWALPRLSGVAKTAMVEIQADEYGGGVAGRAHADLFALTMTALGLDATYGAYVERLPGVTLATVNLVTLFGLHRRLRGALVGHLAAFEMSSVVPMGRYASAFRRLGVDGAEFYDVHVEADVHHEVVAANQLAAGLVAAEPDQGGEVLFGALAVTAAEKRFSEHLLGAWERGQSSLRLGS